MLRENLKKILSQKDKLGRACGTSEWGVYAFYDFDGEPIYVGQTREKLSSRINRHLTNQRSDAVAMRILDPFEVAEVEVWPLWDLADRKLYSSQEAKEELDLHELSVWVAAVKGSKFSAVLNEKRPRGERLIELPESFGGILYEGQELEARKNPDIRIARRAETLSRLAAVARERGIVSAGLRRTLALQAIRLAYLTSVRSAVEDGRPIPRPSAIDSESLVGAQFNEAEFNGTNTILAMNPTSDTASRKTLISWSSEE